MATTTHHHPAGISTRLAHWLGRTWARTWHKAGVVLVSTGLPPKAATTLTWVAKLAIIAAALYVAFWVVLVVGLVILLLNGVDQRRVDNTGDYQPTDWMPTSITELRNKPGYDPVFYNDHDDYRYDADD
ncbi:MAG: DUF3742 family protein [Betaproteobacteria bacterium]|nr:DUF3742 family protein [Betaproteobacteria bacterium]